MAGDSKKEEMSVELDTLKEDVQKLANDLKDMLHTVNIQGREKLAENKKRLEAAIKTLRGEAGEKFDEAYEYVCDHGKEAVEKSRKQIEERPLTAVGIALAVGILLGALIRRR
jgi:ElaB/YqjD/DUF883 family membrane-anchored ribosome-binding protein